MGLAAGAALASRLPAGLLYRGARARWLLAGALLAFAAATLLFAVATVPLAIALLRLAGGASFGVATTVNLAQFVETLPPERDRAQAMGYYAGALATGYAVGNGLGGLVVEWLGFGWGFLFAAGLLLLGLPFALVGAAPSRAQQVTPAATGAPAPGTALQQLQRAARHPPTRGVLVAAFLLAFLIQMYSAYQTLYALGVGISLAEAGLIRTLFSIMQAVLRSGAAPAIRWLGRARAQHLGLAGQAGFMIVVGSVGGFWPLLAASLGVGACRAVAFVANTQGLAQEVDEQTVSRGVASGLFNAAIDLGMIAGPAATGVVAQSIGLSATFHYLPPLLLLVYALAMLGSRAPRTAPVRRNA